MSDLPIKNLLEKSRALREQGNSKGVSHADDAYRQAKASHNHPLTILALKEKISYALHMHADFDEVEKLSNELLDLIKVDNDKESGGFVYNILGIASDARGDYLGARGYYLQAVKLLESARQLSESSKITLGNVYYNLNKLYTQLETDEERFGYLDKAEKIFESAAYYDGLSRLWNMRASMLPDEAPIAERLAIFEKAYSYFPEGTCSEASAMCQANIGLCYCHLQKFDKGLRLLEKALADIKKINRPPSIAFIQFQMAEGLRLKGDFNAAMDYLHQAETILVKTGTKAYLNVVYKEWANNLAAVGKFKEAYEKLLHYADETANRIEFDRRSAVEEAQLKFELEKVEREAELLRIKNSEIELYNQRLQNSVAELNQFAYVASHDLKEPLRMVTSYMQLLEKSFNGKLDEDQAIYVRYAAEGAQRMFTLIDSLLAFARATIDTELQPVDLNLVLEEVMHIVLSHKAQAIDITFDKLPVLMADNNQMLQLFQNLIANAVKYNESQQIKIHISYKLENHAHTFAVSDNGIGIPLQHRQKVFDIFKRLHNRETYSGTGIGLAICKKIVNRFNGKIWIEDGNLGGVSFVFTIPANDAPIHH
jgi:signal transduction histidine kinase